MITTERPAEYLSSSSVVNGRVVVTERTRLTPNEGSDIYTIVAERPAELLRLHSWLLVTEMDTSSECVWEAGIVLAEDGTGRAVTWRQIEDDVQA